jgi:hypothetical protein
MTKKQTQEQWWKDDADRVNKMAEAARKLGVTAKMPDKKVDDADSKPEEATED